MQTDQFVRRNAKSKQVSPVGKSISKIESTCRVGSKCARAGELVAPGMSSDLIRLKRHPSTKPNLTSFSKPAPITTAVPSKTITLPVTVTCTGAGRFVPRKKQPTCTSTSSSLHLANKPNASSSEILFIWVANRFGFQLARFLATKFGWNLQQNWPEAQLRHSEARKAYTKRNTRTRRWGARGQARR